MDAHSQRRPKSRFSATCVTFGSSGSNLRVPSPTPPRKLIPQLLKVFTRSAPYSPMQEEVPGRRCSVHGVAHWRGYCVVRPRSPVGFNCRARSRPSQSPTIRHKEGYSLDPKNRKLLGSRRRGGGCRYASECRRTPTLCCFTDEVPNHRLGHHDETCRDLRVVGDAIAVGRHRSSSRPLLLIGLIILMQIR